MKKPLYKRIGERIIDEMLVAGIAVVIFIFGVDYFGLNTVWVDLLKTLSAATGMNLNTAEITLILGSLTKVFPFNLLFGDMGNIVIALIVGILLTVVGFLLKMWITPSKEKFIEDLGRELMIPAVIGVVGILLLQIITAFTIKNHFASKSASEFAIHFNSGLFIWNTFGSVLITAVVTLVLGSVILVVAKSKKVQEIILVGRTMVTAGYVLLGYYVFVRLIGMSIVLDSPMGDFLKMFIISGEFSNFFIIVCVFMFTFGRELRKYGKYLRLKKKYVLRKLGIKPREDMSEREKKQLRKIPKAPKAVKKKKVKKGIRKRPRPQYGYNYQQNYDPYNQQHDYYGRR